MKHYLCIAVPILIGQFAFLSLTSSGQDRADVTAASPLNENAAFDFTAEELLPLLRLNDAQFDALKMRYQISYFNQAKTQTAIVAPKASGSKFDLQLNIRPGIDLENLTAEEMRKHLQSGEVRFDQPGGQSEPTVSRFLETMMVRSPDLAAERESMPGEEVPLGHNRVHRWRSLGTELRQMYASQNSSKNADLEWIVEVSQEPRPINNYQEQWMWRKLALGVGYGEKISQITAIEPGPRGRLVAHGNLKIWGTDESTFEIELDEDLLVRKAVIQSIVGDAQTNFHVTTSDTAQWQSNQCKCARKGTFRRTSGSGKLLRHFDIQMEEMEFGVTQGEFDEFAKLEPPKSAKVFLIDHDKPRNFDIKQTRTVARVSHIRSWLLATNAVFIAVLLFMLVKRRHVHGS